MFDLSFKRIVAFVLNQIWSDGGEFPMRKHRGSIASIDIKLMILNFDLLVINLLFLFVLSILRVGCN